ncbi:MAG: hypothetical protein ABJG78_12080 [Cyclobacteriaceae bacterium]
MKENEINNTAFLFIELLETTIEQKKNSSSELNTGSSQDHLQSVDLTNNIIDGPFVETELNHDHTVSNRKVSVEDKSYQFNKTNFKKCQEFIREINSLQFFQQTTSYQFLEEKAFNWMIDVKSSGKAETDLTNYLMDETEKVIEEVTYYFHVVNLHIFAPFKIGNVDITFFTKEYFDDFWEVFEKKDEGTKEDFDGLYRKYQGWVFAAFEVRAEPKRGEEIAYEECCKAIDVLKCFTTTNLFPSRKCFMDLQIG